MRAILSIPLAAGFCFGQTDVLTYHNDNARTGQNLSETVLTPSIVQTSFGKLFSVSVDGKVDAQPLVASGLTINAVKHNVAFAASEHDSVYAFNADTGALFWKVTMLKQGEVPSDSRGCNQVSPEIGVTATPVIDRTAGPHGTMYIVAMSKDAASNYHQRLHALDLTTGGEQFGGPIDIAATYPGHGDNSSNGVVVFDPKQYKSRPGLMLVNGIVYTSWSSHCDNRPYTGWTIGYNQNTLQQVSVFNFAPNGSEASIWASGGGQAADASGNLFFQVANGTFDTTLNAQGLPSQGDYGNAFVKVLPGTGQLKAADYWTMYNTVSESNADQDLGSGGLLLLPDVLDSNGRIRHLGAGAGKDRNVYIFDRDNMGKFNAGDSSNSNLYQELAAGLSGGEFGSPAWFNGKLYFGGQGDSIRAFSFSAGKFALSSSTSNQFGYPGATPAISANGTLNAVLWAVENSNPAVLHAYDATHLSSELYNSNRAANGRDQFGAGNKFITPTIANGKVLVGTTNSVAVFGELSTVLLFETESLPYKTSGPQLQRLSWSGFPDGVGTKFLATKTGDSVTFTLNIPTAGTYDLRMDAKKLNIRGIFQLSINGVNVGGPEDEYAQSEAFQEYDLGQVTLNAGAVDFKFTVVGKNPASSAPTLSFDYIKLTR